MERDVLRSPFCPLYTSFPGCRILFPLAFALIERKMHLHSVVMAEAL